MVRKSFSIAVKQDERYAANHGGREYVPQPGHHSKTAYLRDGAGPLEQYLSDQLGIRPITARVNGKWVIDPRMASQNARKFNHVSQGN
jgi:hypothetical protein